MTTSTAVAVALRTPGWTFAVTLDAVAAVGAFATLHWGPANTHRIAALAATLVIAIATASLCDDDLVDLTSTSALTLRRRTAARLVLGLLPAVASGAVVVVAVAGEAPRQVVDDLVATMVLIVALGTAVGVAAARLRPDVPAAVPAALVLVAGTLLAQELTLPAAVRSLSVLDDTWIRTAWVVLLAVAVILATTRDRAGPPLSRRRSGAPNASHPTERVAG